ncbi:hypothetical protein [Stenotrophomonas phage vB_SmaS_BUCT548]|uniref:Uncharacterized protein n=1 Tax=Stenotrophomonas phage vB_SmaS_BUCT548 TaxID=2712941 RepID=A0A7D2LSA5_9CAUD|nr:hypothetical protein PQD75_gp089 [Stenotrophomonas phage vB_SmaS_BUCT548]QIQ60783.1 hypothetical protein [Stenotrophomonas phage vB_SmaS_BUCT548]WFG37956.1 hypothetical protein 20Sep420_00071 [Pseudomonas phage 20Sep420]
MNCELCDPNSKDPRRIFMQCWCGVRNMEQEGYDAYVSILAKGFEPSFFLGMQACPYPLGTDDRKAWMKGWGKAREEA